MGEFEDYLKKQNISREQQKVEHLTLFNKEYDEKPLYTVNIGGQAHQVSMDQIFDALKEQVDNPFNSLEDDMETDLYGWSVIYATDEKGKSRPFCLMRSLPTHTPDPYGSVREDDEALADILLSEIYDLTKRRVRWIKFKNKIKSFFRKFIK